LPTVAKFYIGTAAQIATGLGEIDGLRRTRRIPHRQRKAVRHSGSTPSKRAGRQARIAFHARRSKAEIALKIRQFERPRSMQLGLAKLDFDAGTAEASELQLRACSHGNNSSAGGSG
jgi:hypothetical protein